MENNIPSKNVDQVASKPPEEKNHEGLIPNEITEQVYSDFLKDKNVAIVCPSKSMEGLNMGSEINSVDVIVRMNESYEISPEQEKDFGNRTDVVYHYLGLASENQPGFNLEKIKQSKVKMIVIPPRPEKRNFEVFHERNASLSIPFLRISQDDKKELWNKIECLPFCGTWAVFHVLKFPVKTVKIFGMNFFATGHYSGHDHRTEQQQIAYALNSQFDKRGIEKQHHIEPQKKFLYEICMNDKRIILDDITKKAINIP
ncbi:MAG: glycosyltransferase family 29 protein [Candidatus Nomurabacteria bacterium]|nr:glycosyltransferase family 29 protein [Candidatus Nomurabacteria bacterium]